VKWLTNYQIFENGGLPSGLLALVGPPRTIAQGRANLDSQFRFAGSAAADDQGVSLHLSTFRQSFAIVTAVSENGKGLDPSADDEVFRPGFLRAT
jgi:hypothetical protein